MPPSFSQPERRSFLVPVLIALAAIALAVFVAVRFFPATSVDIEHLSTAVLPTSTVYKSRAIVEGPANTQRALFVATTVRIRNQLRSPIFPNSFTCTFTDQAGAVLTVTGASKPDLDSLRLSFPALKPLVAHPLQRDVVIDPGKSTKGTMLFSFPFTQAQWNARKSALIKIDLYQGQALYVDIPGATSAPPAQHP